MSDRRLSAPHSSGTGTARLGAPPNACDCHMHFFDSRFPMAAGDTRKLPDASVADYRLLQQRIGTTRVVVVQPSTYGTDNRCTLDALARLGDAARGVVVVDTSVSDAELQQLSDAGVRGIRFNIARPGATTVEMLEPLSTRVNELGWHVQVHMDAHQIAEIGPLLNRLASPIVFDHMGRIPPSDGPSHPAFGVIRRLLDKGRSWVKLSGVYLESKAAPPGYADLTPLARAFVEVAPERMLWGSDWPHPSAKQKPDDASLFELLGEWAPDHATRHRILVDNPQALYGFPSQ